MIMTRPMQLVALLMVGILAISQHTPTFGGAGGAGAGGPIKSAPLKPFEGIPLIIDPNLPPPKTPQALFVDLLGDFPGGSLKNPIPPAAEALKPKTVATPLERVSDSAAYDSYIITARLLSASEKTAGEQRSEIKELKEQLRRKEAWSKWLIALAITTLICWVRVGLRWGRRQRWHRIKTLALSAIPGFGASAMIATVMEMPASISLVLLTLLAIGPLLAAWIMCALRKTAAHNFPVFAGKRHEHPV